MDGWLMRRIRCNDYDMAAIEFLALLRVPFAISRHSKVRPNNRTRTKSLIVELAGVYHTVLGR